jgi:hypothetical protein
MGGACSTNVENRNEYRLLMGKPEGKGPLRKPRRRWVDNIKMDLVEAGWGDVDRIGLAQDRDNQYNICNTQPSSNKINENENTADINVI